jgi:esterase/lipase superfamily enzyme
MLKEHHLIENEAMGRKMHVWKYGHFGIPLLVFPSAAGMAHEWDAHGMIEALADWIDAGKLKVFCTESNVAEAWTRKEEGTPAERVKRHQAYEHFVTHELIDFIRRDCQSEDIEIGTTGTSMGAYYAANFALKKPEVFSYALCLSGRYDITWMTDGFNNHDIYLANPMAYVPNLEGEHLQRIREKTFLTLVCGQGKWEDGNIEDTQKLASLFEAKGIKHQCDLWGHDVAHQWDWWKRQARFHLEPRIMG